MRVTALLLAFLAGSAASSPFSPLAPRSLQKRGLEKCKNLEAKSNNGGRKIGIVVDESGSMELTDPYNLRIPAAKAVNDWLISSNEAGNGKEADLVTVIGFDDTSRVYYPLGDPSGADKVIDEITIVGGTYIAGGLDTAMTQLNASGHDPTANRTGVVIFTDGSDSYTTELVDYINHAGAQGVRVSFGFLAGDSYSGGYSYQDPTVLEAVKGTGGFYATITGAQAQNAFANVMIVHGLTDNDNPTAGNLTDVYNGLAIAFVLGDDGSSTLTYAAESNEHLTFTISSVTAVNDLQATAEDTGGKDIGSITVDAYSSSYLPEELVVTASSSGNLNLKIKGDASDAGAMFIVGVNSSIPLTNCTLGDDTSSGLSTGAKAGIGIAVPLLVGVFAAGSYFLWKYWKGIPPKTGHAPVQYTPDPPLEKAPYVSTTPMGAHPGFAAPPPKFPHGPQHHQNNANNPDNIDQNQPYQPNNSNSPGDLHQGNSPNNATQGDHYNYNQPHQPHNGPSDMNQQPFNQADPLHHPTNASDMLHNPQGDPGHHAPTNASDLPQNPQADPGHHGPTNASDMPHNPQADPNHHTPTNASDMPNNPQADPSHHDPTNASDMPQNPQADPNHHDPTNASDPSHQPPQQNPNNAGDSSQQPPQGDPNQPGQNPNDNPHPKRLPQPRFPFRMFGRRRKKDEENEQQQQLAVYQGQAYAPQPALDHGQNGMQNIPTSGSVLSPAPQASVNAHRRPALNNELPAPQQYQTSQYGQAVPMGIPHQAVPASPQSQRGQGQSWSYQNTPQQAYASPHPLIQQFPQPPVSRGNDTVEHAVGMNREVYNVSPVQQDVEPVRHQGQGEVISPMNTGMRSVSRRPVGGQ